jgi:hypothetical protein
MPSPPKTSWPVVAGLSTGNSCLFRFFSVVLLTFQLHQPVIPNEVRDPSAITAMPHPKRS